MLHKSFKPAKCKTALKLVVSRSKLLKNKKEVLVKQLRRDLAQLLESGLDQTARIRVEHVVREEKMMAAYELIEIFCELIAIRLPIIESQKNCPIDLKEAVASVIFAAPRCSDIPELADVRKHFTAKYGKEFVSAAIELRPDCGVNRNLVEKLSAKAPDGLTKIKILTAIAEEHNIKWEPKGFGEKDSNHQEDLLNGPKTIENASKIHVESSNAQASYYERVSPNLHMPPQNEVKQEAPVNYHGNNDRLSFGSQNVNSANVNASAAPNPNLRSSGSGIERRESGNVYTEDQSSNFVNRHNWDMEFKDATSAAQAAAESAERASMAARAAAELSSRGKITTHYSTGSQRSSNTSREEMPRRDEMPRREEMPRRDEIPRREEMPRRDEMRRRKSGSSRSSFDDEALARDQMSSNLGERNSRSRSEEIDDQRNSRPSNLTTAASSSDSSRGNNSSSRPTEHRMRDEIPQIYGVGNYQGQTFVEEDEEEEEEEEDVDLATLTERLRGGGRPSETGSGPSSSKKTSGHSVSNTTGSFHTRRDSQNLHQSENVVTLDEFSMGRHTQKSEEKPYDETQDMFRAEKASNLEDERSTRHSRIASSHSSISSLEDAVVGNPFANFDEEKYHVVGKSTQESGSVVFDDYGSDGENSVFDLDKGPETRSNIFSPDRKSTSYLSEHTSPPSPRRNRIDVFGKTVSDSQPSVASASVFSESVDDSAVRVQEDELPPPVFDDPMGPQSESEKELEDLKRHPEDNLSSRPRRSDFNLIAEKSEKFEDTGATKKQQQSRYSRASSDEESDDDNDSWTPRRSATTDNSETLAKSDTDGEMGLRFGKLTGGRRNKGYMHPPYVKSSLAEASSPKQAAASEVKKSSASEIRNDPYDQGVDTEIQKRESSMGTYGRSSLGEASVVRKLSEDIRDKIVERKRLSGRLEDKSKRSSSSEAVDDLSARYGFSIPSRNVRDSEPSEDTKGEVLFQVSDSPSRGRYGAGISRRTNKGSPSKSERSSLLKPSLAPPAEEAREPQKYSSRSSYTDRRSEMKSTYPSKEEETEEKSLDVKSSPRRSFGSEGYRSTRTGRSDMEKPKSEPLTFAPEEFDTPERIEGIRSSPRSSYGAEAYRSTQTERLDNEKPESKPLRFASKEVNTAERREDIKSSRRSSYGVEAHKSTRTESLDIEKPKSKPLRSSSEEVETRERREDTISSPRSSYGSEAYRNARTERSDIDKPKSKPLRFASEEVETRESREDRKSSPRSSYGSEAYKSTRTERLDMEKPKSKPSRSSSEEVETREDTKSSLRSSYGSDAYKSTRNERSDMEKPKSKPSRFSSEEFETRERREDIRSSKSSYDAEANKSARSEKAASDGRGSSDRLQSSKEAATGKPKAEVPKSSERPSDSPSESSKPVKPSLGDTSRENSFNKASHVHPKLPDYDTVAAQLELFRANRK